MHIHGMDFLPSNLIHFYKKFKIIHIDPVTAFMVLSGFLIGRIIIKIIDNTNFSSQDLFDFWIRRWFRTLPNYFLILFFVVVLNKIFINDLRAFDFNYITFTQNFFSTHPIFFPEAWSLSIEEWFYLLFPLAIFCFIKFTGDKKRSIILVACFFLILPLVIRILKFENLERLPFLDPDFRSIIIYRFDTFMYGFFGGYCYIYFPILWRRCRLLLLNISCIALILMYLNLFNVDFYTPLKFNIESLIVLFLLPYLSLLKNTRFKCIDNFFIFFSVISYSMYLLNHTMVSQYFIQFMHKAFGTFHLPKQDTFIINLSVFWLLTTVLAFLQYRIYEKPMTDLRDKFST